MLNAERTVAERKLNQELFAAREEIERRKLDEIRAAGTLASCLPSSMNMVLACRSNALLLLQARLSRWQWR